MTAQIDLMREQAQKLKAMGEAFRQRANNVDDPTRSELLIWAADYRKRARALFAMARDQRHANT